MSDLSDPTVHYLIRGTTIDAPPVVPGTEVEVRLRATVVDDWVVDEEGVVHQLALRVTDWAWQGLAVEAKDEWRGVVTDAMVERAARALGWKGDDGFGSFEEAARAALEAALGGAAWVREHGSSEAVSASPDEPICGEAS